MSEDGVACASPVPLLGSFGLVFSLLRVPLLLAPLRFVYGVFFPFAPLRVSSTQALFLSPDRRCHTSSAADRQKVLLRQLEQNTKPAEFGVVSRVTVQVKPPKDRLIKDFTLNWRPNSDIVYVFETEASGYFGPILGMYEKQTVTHNKMFLYRQVWKRNGHHCTAFVCPWFPSLIPEFGSKYPFSWRMLF